MKGNRTRLTYLAPWIGVASVLVLWQAVVSLRILDPAIFPGPVQVAESAVTDLSPMELANHIRASLTRVVLGFALGTFLGIAIGIASGWYVTLGKIVWTPIEILRPIPPLAWIPLALIWFGLGEQSKIFIIFLGAFFPIVTNTYKGMLSVDPMLLRAGQMMGLKGPKLLMRVAIPAAMPDIATGLRIGWSLAFGSLVAAEILAAQEGLGYMIMHARELGQIGLIVFGIIIIGVVTFLTDYLLNELFLKRQLRWHTRS